MASRVQKIMFWDTFKNAKSVILHYFPVAEIGSNIHLLYFSYPQKIYSQFVEWGKKSKVSIFPFRFCSLLGNTLHVFKILQRIFDKNDKEAEVGIGERSDSWRVLSSISSSSKSLWTQKCDVRKIDVDCLKIYILIPFSKTFFV